MSMTPFDKARSLVYQMHYYQTADSSGLKRAKESAHISVDEIIMALSVPPIKHDGMLWKAENDYWHKVKDEISRQ